MCACMCIYRKEIIVIAIKVDIYSYGLMLFELMTNGHKPFEELSTGFEIDKFVVEVSIYLHVQCCVTLDHATFITHWFSTYSNPLS